MLTVIEIAGAYELNWAWLPYWLVCDQEFRDQVELAFQAVSAAQVDDRLDAFVGIDACRDLHEGVKRLAGEKYPDSGITELITALESLGS